MTHLTGIRQHGIGALVATLAVLIAAATLYAPPPPGHGGGNGGGGGGGGGGQGSPPDPAIVFNEMGDVMVMNADGSNEILVLAEANGSLCLQPSFSADGTQIVFNGDLPPFGPGVYVVGIDGMDLQFIAPLDFGSCAEGRPVWSPVPAPDGLAKILFADSGPTGARDIFAVNIDGSGRINLTQSAGSETHPSWAPDATAFAIACGGGVRVHDLGVVDGELAIVATLDLCNMPGSPLENVGVDWPNWARTMDVIAVTAALPESDYRDDIWLIDLLDPANPVNLTGDSNSHERYPSWSPDDTQIVYWKAAGSGPSGIFVMNADGSNRERLSGSHTKYPDWRRY